MVKRLRNVIGWFGASVTAVALALGVMSATPQKSEAFIPIVIIIIGGCGALGLAGCGGPSRVCGPAGVACGQNFNQKTCNQSTGFCTTNTNQNSCDCISQVAADPTSENEVGESD